MTKTEIIQDTEFGPLTWITSAEVEGNYDADEDRGDAESTCATCEQKIQAGTRYLRCIDNGEEIHEACPFPTWE